MTDARSLPAELLSYAKQSAHFFQRDHEQAPSAAVEGASAWAGTELDPSAPWRIVLSDDQISELETALEAGRREGEPLEALTKESFPLPTLAAEIARWRQEIHRGRGFLLLRGLPVARWSEADAERVFWGLGLHMGRPGAQNPQGDLLGHVTDTGADAADPFVRLYRTSSDIAYHCDAADVVGLLCLRAARSGGASRIVSSVRVFNEVLRRRPDLVERLFEPFLLDIRNEDGSGALRYLPIPPCRYADGRLRTFYHSDYFRSVVRHDDVPPFPEREQTLIDLYEEIANDPALFLDMELAPGDVQWLSNHSVLHSRTGYEDHPEPERRRHLLRLWLSIG